jgi:hypothetical protein
MNKKPIHIIRFGAVKAAIWENTAGEATRHNVTFAKLYKDGEAWKVSESFGRDDLLPLAKVADHAHSWICEQAQAKSA